jgi:hypothetical protein
MKVVHVLKRIETIDEDVKDLRKLEKSLSKDKSFTTAIYMSIEKQINILLGERIKMLELKIENPPEQMVEEIEGKPEEREEKKKEKKTSKKKTVKKKPVKKKAKVTDIDDIPMLTQDQIDAKISNISITKKEKKTEEKTDEKEIKLLDTALEHGTLNKKNLEESRDKKVKFFRENFPSD